eukprot:GILI01021091.1.p2 GENE.GILI01021091.1~~GILI01021091.1.p2  ORF type:complete len:183 (-),score=54.72 GILI01021091.1:134-682(-)
MEVGALLKAVNFAAKKHSDQRRKDPQQTPYINHPIGVAMQLWDAGVTDIVTLQAAVLHDTVEDTDTTFEEIEAEFGKEVRDVVAEVTDDTSLSSEERKERQVMSSAGKSPRAKLVKLSDKLYNLRDLLRALPVGWTTERSNKYFEVSWRIVHGLRGSNAVLESQLDEAFARAAELGAVYASL